jgi:PAS domain S-box-containing protein
MPKLYAKVSVYGAFTLLLLLLILNAAVTRQQLGEQMANQALSAHSQEVLLNISELRTLLVDAETGQRGYLYTGDPRYLEPYQAATSKIAAHLDSLEQLTADNPAQQARIPELRSFTQQKLDELARTIALYQSGRQDEARRTVLDDSGKIFMDKIRALLGDMWQEEISLSRQRDAEYQRSTRRTIWSIYLATIIASIGLALLGYYVLKNIGERERYTTAIREREQWFRVTLGSIGDAVLATDAEGKVTYANEIAESLTGFRSHELAGKPVLEAFPIFNELTREPTENPVDKVFKLGRIVGLANHTVLRHRDGRLIPIEDSAAPIRNDNHEIIGVVLVFRDATHERHSQELLRRAEKLAAAGRLASTMAHEINNPLEAVGNLIFLAKHAPELPSETREQLTMAEQQLERVAHITRQTLGFHREQATPEEVQLAAIAESVLSLYDNKLRTKSIAVERDFRQVQPILGLSGELRQIVANLVSNAADAVPSNGRIKLSILPAHTNGTAGAELSVEDDGPGIPRENVNRIFEPFFTTKADVGTGLGLWVVKELVERYGGSVRVSGRNGQGGSVFTVFFPTKDAAASHTSSA